MPLLTEVPSSKSKRETDRQTDRQTDMCNPTDAIASKNHGRKIMPFQLLFMTTLMANQASVVQILSSSLLKMRIGQNKRRMKIITPGD